jgi:hypothetical protein
MLFVEFYEESTGWNGKDFSGPITLIPASGSSGVFILDKRRRIQSQVNLAREMCRARKYKGFVINDGSFTKSKLVRSLEVLP